MFSWVRKSWNRRTRWSPLLKNQREFQRALSKERSRVDRHGGYFGFIILRLCHMHDAQTQIRQLAKVLYRRLRETDEMGHLGPGRIGVILPVTESAGTSLVLADVLRLATQAGLSIDGEAFVYPDQDTGQRRQKRQTEQSAEDSIVVQAMPLAMVVDPYSRWKRAIDILGASLGLIVSSPIILVSAVLIKLTSPGPIIFRQQRTGYLGSTFTIYKLRSMVLGAAEMQSELQERNERDGPAFKITRDPRTTGIGRFLRATGLDELPQLYNVLKGDMALVGPRPLPVDEAAQCQPWQKRRVDTKPGLTCFWQIAKSRSISFPDWMRLDLRYVKKATFLLDMRLLAKTVMAVFLGRVGH